MPVLLLGASLGLCAGGCVAPPSGAAIEAERTRALWAERRAAELERRLGEVERQRIDAEARAQLATTAELRRLHAAHEQLLARVARLEQPADGAPLTQLEPQRRPSAAAAASVEARVLELLGRLHDDSPPWRGGLSREKREALRILLREERVIDSQNPLEL